jgi:hypothetical protein
MPALNTSIEFRYQGWAALCGFNFFFLFLGGEQGFGSRFWAR